MSRATIEPSATSVARLVSRAGESDAALLWRVAIATRASGCALYRKAMLTPNDSGGAYTASQDCSSTARTLVRFAARATRGEDDTIQRAIGCIEGWAENARESMARSISRGLYGVANITSASLAEYQTTLATLERARVFRACLADCLTSERTQ